MASPYGEINVSNPNTNTNLLQILPIQGKLKSGEEYQIFRVAFNNKNHYNEKDLKDAIKYSISLEGKPNLLSYLSSILDDVIEAGDTYPQEEKTGIDGFSGYFLSHAAFMLIKGSKSELEPVLNDFDQKEFWTERVMGMFYIKPNFPGRSSHICNGGFITAPKSRSLGVGKEMGLAFIKLAPALGYKASLFNLVFESNTSSVRLWRSLGFIETGRIPKAGRLRNSDKLVDAINFYYDFTK
ncbi:hypothetical protein BB558_003279 [Smittium angustum]|uniref:N-acetyltransferase domain-containing protein n=1 Tax=Smittium angustum TaxID=133377 RepID=A0A2U1J153_SMIAN|nr:hypothetical protein BB558_005197 [Smittium angustum]PWA00662.1 hypothetical protein BB558_003279 [Smittium angustum]